MNREWHERHPMPSRASLAQRVEWHREHAIVCGCRRPPEAIADIIAGHAPAPPAPPTHDRRPGKGTTGPDAR